VKPKKICYKLTQDVGAEMNSSISLRVSNRIQSIFLV